MLEPNIYIESSYKMEYEYTYYKYLRLANLVVGILYIVAQINGIIGYTNDVKNILYYISIIILILCQILGIYSFIKKDLQINYLISCILIIRLCVTSFNYDGYIP